MATIARPASVGNLLTAQAIEEVAPSNPRVDQEEVARLSQVADLLALRNPATGAHARRVGLLSGDLALHCGFDPLRARSIRLASSLHDIGKLAIPDTVLDKGGPLSDLERERLQDHPRLGHDLLVAVGSPLFRLAALIALRHHERIDGSGYPDGLVGEKIPLAARIVTVADCFEALVGERSYRRSLSRAEAIEVMRAESGPHLDARILDLFVVGRETALDGKRPGLTTHVEG